MKSANSLDLICGGVFVLVGGAFLAQSLYYEIGTSARMGPGFLPLLLGGLLAGLGGVQMLLALRRGIDLTAISLTSLPKPLIWIPVAVGLFALALTGLPFIGVPALGLIPAIFISALTASLAGEAFSLRGSATLALVLAGASYLLFVLALGLPVQAWPGGEI